MKEFKKLMKWSSEEFAHLPWRKERSLFRTLVSEIMLQQTTVGTVLNHFDRFIKKYPNLKKLAKASEEEIQIEWKGLGYYRRARNLLKAAKFIRDNYKGEIPTEYGSLVAIPGIGDYTASAIISIGANKKALAVDANIDRVVSRIFDIKTSSLSAKKKLAAIKQTIDDGTIPIGRFRNFRAFNESLMDLGRVYCQARKASCQICPMNESCQSLYKGKVRELIQNKEKKIKKIYEVELARIIVSKNRKILAIKKRPKEWLEGQWELPTFIIKTEDKRLRQYPNATSGKNKLNLNLMKPLVETKSTITKYKFNNKVYKLSRREWEKSGWGDLINEEQELLWINKDDPRIANTCTKILKKINYE